MLVTHISVFAIYSASAGKKKNVRQGSGRMKSVRLEFKCLVTALNPFTGAVLKPDSSRRKFSTVCGIMARETVFINLASWKNVGKTTRAALAKEILGHFDSVVDSSPKTLKRVGNAAILIASKAWKHWKSRLVSESAL